MYINVLCWYAMKILGGGGGRQGEEDICVVLTRRTGVLSLRQGERTARKRRDSEYCKFFQKKNTRQSFEIQLQCLK